MFQPKLTIYLVRFQVHRATLHDDWVDEFDVGNEVAVKVMHRGVEQMFHHDFQVFRNLCQVALSGWKPCK